MKRPHRNRMDYTFLFLKGLGMGAANKVPGVSGGIVAFVGGFYEEFIYSLKKINHKALLLLVSGRFKSLYQYINGSFLLLLLLGMLVSYFSVSKILDHLLEQYETNVWASFFGMILGSIYYIGNQFKHWNKQTIGFGLLGLIMGISLSFLEPATENDHLLFVFFCGIISVSGMALPGLSGSFILMILGNYVLLLVDSVNALYDSVTSILSGDFSFLSDATTSRRLKILGIFTLGSSVGLVSLSHLISYVLKKFNDITTAVIIGFISGSLGVVWPWKKTIYKTDALGTLIIDSNENPVIVNYERYLPDLKETDTYWGFFWILSGLLFLIILEYYGQRRKK
ncbi:MAG: DUF368 domain-containing protein [Flavobacteriia bacterium]|nr:DUF368 domain-containing protein [Flavobacteriia bacterium]